MKYINLICILLLTACTANACNPNPNPNYAEEDFRKGYEGVVVTMPVGEKSTLFEGDTRPYSVLIHNRGTSDIDSQNPLSITLSYDSFYVEHLDYVDSLIIDDLVLGKSRTFPFGDQIEYQIGAFKAKPLTGQVQSPETDLFINICYPYSTTLYQSVCVNSDIYQTSERRVVCDPQDYLPQGGQGAPIAVTKIEPDILLVDQGFVRPLFRITIENKGEGIPYFASNGHVVDFCQLNDVDRTTQNKVLVRAWLNPGETDRTKGLLTCKPVADDSTQTVVSLVDGKATVFCSLEEGSSIIADYNYPAVLLVEIDYIYSEGLSHKIEINRR